MSRVFCLWLLGSIHDWLYVNLTSLKFRTDQEESSLFTSSFPFDCLQFNNRFDNSHLVCSIGEYLSKQQQLSGESPSSVPAPGSTGTSPSSEMRVFCELNNMLQKSRGRASEIRTQQKMMESGVLVLADRYSH